MIQAPFVMRSPGLAGGRLLYIGGGEHIQFPRLVCGDFLEASLEVRVPLLRRHEVLHGKRQLVPGSGDVQEDAAGEDHQEAPYQQGSQDAYLDLVGGDLQKDANCGRDGLHVVRPVDVLHTFDHEDTHHDQRRPGGEGRDGGQQRRHEDADKVQEGNHERGEAGAATLINTGHGLAVGRHRAGAQEAADEGSDRIRHEGGVAARKALGLLGVNQAAQVCGRIQKAHGSDEVNVEQGQQGVPEALPVPEAREVPSQDSSAGDVAALAVAICVTARPSGERSNQWPCHIDQGKRGKGAWRAEGLRNAAGAADAALPELIEHELGTCPTLVGHGGPAARLHQDRVETNWVEAPHHGMARIRAAALEG